MKVRTAAIALLTVLAGGVFFLATRKQDHHGQGAGGGGSLSSPSRSGTRADQHPKFSGNSTELRDLLQRRPRSLHADLEFWANAAVKDDPEEMWRELLADKSLSFHQSAPSFLSAWLKQDSDGALDAFFELAEKFPGQAQYFATGMLHHSRLQELEAIWPRVWENIDAKGGSPLLDATLRAMAGLDAVLAIEHLDRIAPTKRPRGSVETCARHLAAQAPQKVADWLAARTSKERDAAEMALGYGFLQSFSSSRDRQSLVSNLAGMPPRVRAIAVRGAAATTASDAVMEDSLKRWFQVLPRLGEQNESEMRSLVLEQYAIKGGQKLVHSIDASLLPQNEVNAVATGFAKADPAGAFEWARNLAAGEAQVQAVEKVVSLWISSEPFAVSRKVHALDPGPARDHALKKLVEYADREGDPTNAKLWAQEISDPEMRSSILLGLAGDAATE